ncbi:MAG: AAA family ATPase [Anaerolineae bacterium]|nr:AAA family ATPase [Anaerolineae bacterium]
MTDDSTRLDPAKLYHYTDPSQFGFETTDEVEDLTEVIGQPRAVEAMEFGMAIEEKGYNIYAMGPPGIGKQSLMRQFFEERARDEPAPSDWCYVNNFEDDHKPNAIELPAGLGVELRDDVQELVEQFDTALSAAFESEEYQSRRQSIMEEFRESQQQAFQDLQRRAEEEDVRLIRTPAGLAVAPVRGDEVLSPDEIQELSEEEQGQLQQKVEEMQAELQEILRQVPSWQRDMRERLNELNREMANLAVGGLIDELREKYSDYPEVVDHLDAVQEDVVENAETFLPQGGGQQQGGQQALQQMLQGGQGQAQAQQAMVQEALMRKYKVNVLVDKGDTDHAPVVYEDNPTYQNLIGRIEHMARMGALMTDFHLIKAGALHRANGGYLLLDARKVLTEPYAYEALKRAMDAGLLRIESLGRQLSVISTVSLEPEPIPLDVKVGLYGNRLIYYLLTQFDPDFANLFKVEADFHEEMKRDDKNQKLYAQLIATMVHEAELQPFDSDAVARVIERSARMVGDSEKLSTKGQDIGDLLREANHWAKRNGNDVVTATDVEKAINAQIYRADRLRERMQEAILRDTVLIDTEGEEIGQVNGLSIIPLGDFMFGRPTRITARTRMGKGEVVDIEREVELGGPIHSKGVLILSGFLNGRYVEEKPLSLSASLVFEQSYSQVEGDSASSAELYSLLSSLAEAPIKQSMAVTGSVNQRGQVQAIGGVNQKIEGFFDICEARGLTGDQGVLIPASNVKHLMLRQDVVDAVKKGRFHIYPVETVDQGIEILTGVPAGERDKQGNYPEGTINHIVERRLAELAEKRSSFGEGAEEEQGA